MVLMECLFPMLTLVLSTPTAIQLSNGILKVVIQLSIASKISLAVPLGVRHISRKLVFTLPLFTSKYVLSTDSSFLMYYHWNHLLQENTGILACV